MNTSNIDYSRYSKQDYNIKINNNNTNHLNRNSNPINQVDNSKEIKEILIEDIKDSIKNNIKRMCKQEKDMNIYLVKMKEFLTKRNDKYKEIIDCKEYLKKDFENEIVEIDNDKKILKDELINNKIDRENCFEFVTKDDKFDKVVKYLCYEATIEDNFPVIKRGFEKGAINFEDSIKEIRKLSRDLFKLKMFRDKLFEKY